MDLKNKKILLTGGNGFIGSVVKRKLLERGVPKGNITIPRSSEYDLRNKEACAQVVKGKDIVIHLAGMTGSGIFHKTSPGKIFYENLIMGVQLMEEARLAEVKKFLDVGSATEYPEHCEVPLKEEYLWNGYPEESHAPYGLANRIRTVQAKSYREQYDFNAIHLILANVYGPGEPVDRDLVIPSFIRKIDEIKEKGKGFIEVWGTGSATRDFLYVDEAAEGILLAFEKYDVPEPVNLGSGVETSIREMLAALSKLMDYHGEIRYDTTKPEGHLRRVLDISKAREKFGFAPDNAFEKNLMATIDWHKQQ